MTNKIITTEGNVQFQLGDGSGKIINVHPFHVYTIFNTDTVTFHLIAIPMSSGLSLFTSKAEDLEVNGTVYTFEELPDALSEAFAVAGAQARAEIVDELPETGMTNTIYLVPKPDGEGYDEYIYLKDEERWELVGDTSIEFDQFVQKTDFSAYTAATDAKIDAISGAVADEASRAISAESALSDSIDALEDYVDEVSGITDTLDGDIDILEESLAQEASARTDADTVLSGAISSVTEDVAALSGDVTAHTSNTDIHVTAADKTAWADKYTQAEVDGIVSGLNDSIDAVSGAVADETARAQSAETALHDEIENIDLSDYYTKSETSGATELSTAFAAKAELSALTEDERVWAEALTDINGKIGTISGDVDTIEAVLPNKADTSAVTQAVADEATARANADTALSGAVDTALLAYINGAEYISTAKTINFLHGETVIDSIDATAFVKDGMVSNVEISGGSLIIEFNTDAGKEDIVIPLTDIFDPSNYYTKSQTSGATELSTAFSEKLDATAYTPTDLSNYYTKSETSGKSEISTALASKQDTLSAGTGIDITSNVISVTGGVNVVQTTGTSTADVMSQDAVTTQLDGKGDAISLDMAGSPKKRVTFLLKRGGINGTTISFRDLTLGRGLVYGEEGYTTLSTSGLVETTAITTSITTASTDTQVPSAKAVNDSLALKLDTTAYTPTDLSNYYTKSETSGATELSTAFSNKLDATAYTPTDLSNYYTKSETSGKTELDAAFSGYVTTNTEQTISGRKIFTYVDKAIEFKQINNSNKVGFSIKNTADTNNEVASFEFRPNTFRIDGVQHPLMYFGHYRGAGIADAGVPQTVIGFRQYDQANSAAYHMLAPLPEKAKTPFSLTTTFQDFYMPMGFKNGSTMVKADETGVVDLTSEFSGKADTSAVTAHTSDSTIHVTSANKTSWDGAATNASTAITNLGGLKLQQVTQAEYDAITNKDASTLYVIVN